MIGVFSLNNSIIDIFVDDSPSTPFVQYRQAPEAQFLKSTSLYT